MSAMMLSGIVTAVHEASSPSISSNPPSVHTSNVQPGPLLSPLAATSCTPSTPNRQFERPIPTPGSLSFTMPLSSSAVASPSVHRIAVNYTPTALLSQAQPYFPPYLPMPPQNIPNQPWFDPSSHQSFARTPPPGSGQLELNPHMNPTFGQPASSASRALGSPNVIAQPISADTHGAEARNKRQREPHLDLNAGGSDDGHAEKRARCTKSKEEIDKQRRERYQEVRDEVNKQRRERYKQLYAQKKDSINARRRQRYQEANKDNINEHRRQRYQEADKDNINEHRRERYQEADKDNINEQRRERYPEAYAQNKDKINEQRRERYQAADKDNVNEERRQRYQEADKDNINEQRRERYPEAYAQNKDNINEQRRERYQEADKDNVNEQRRERYQEADKDNINEQRRERYPEVYAHNKDNINEQRRARRAHALELQRLRQECLFRSKADEDITHIKRHVLDNMEVECEHCHALRWSAERPTICCRGRQVKLPILLDPPEPLKTLLTEQTRQGRHFRQNIRKYNSAFTMASLEANIDMRFTKGPMAGGPHQFRVSGNVYHRMGPLTPGENQPPRFAQVYILETEDQLKAWQGLPLSLELREDLLRQLGAMLNTHNAYVQVAKRG